jgi:hypothetical protein
MNIPSYHIAKAWRYYKSLVREKSRIFGCCEIKSLASRAKVNVDWLEFNPTT